MTYEEKIESLRHLLRETPDVLSPLQIARWTHQSKNTVYALIKSGRLTAYAYHGSILIVRDRLIDFMCGYGWRIIRKSERHREIIKKFYSER